MGVLAYRFSSMSSLPRSPVMTLAVSAAEGAVGLAFFFLPKMFMMAFGYGGSRALYLLATCVLTLDLLVVALWWLLAW